MKFAIYREDLGTLAARPVKGVLEVSDLPAESFEDRLADQGELLESNEAIIRIGEDQAFTDLDSDPTTYDYTVDTSDWLLNGPWDDECPTTTIGPDALWAIEGEWSDSYPIVGDGPVLFSGFLAYVAWAVDGFWHDETSTTVPVANYRSPATVLVTITVDRYSLTQKQAIVRTQRDRLIAEAVRASHFDRFISDTDLSTFATYISALRSISDTEASPDTVVFPTLGAIAGAADRVLTRQYRRGNIVDGVGLSSGVPTGGIIETATNVNGLYIRTADGGQFCKARLKATYFSVATMAVSWTFPAAFIDLASPVTIPVMSLKNLSNVDDGLSANDIRQCQIIESNRAATSVTFQIKSPTLSFSSGDEIWVNMLAMGRWAA